MKATMGMKVWNGACCQNEPVRKEPHLQTRAIKLLATALLGTAWIVSVSLGLRMLFNYETSAGQVGAVPTGWPAASQIEQSNNQPTLVMLAHPRCPCSRASVNQLAEIMARLNGKMRAYVLFFEPEHAGVEWEDTALRRRAAAIPGVTVLSDVGGVEARRFGAETSGHTLLFAGDGHLLFSGGITESRGHDGESTGERAIVSLVNNGEGPARVSTLVFGCSLGQRENKAPCPR
jgi:hypothetical protein